MECSIQRGKAELNRTFHLSPHENICTIALITIHYLYIICVIRYAVVDLSLGPTQPNRFLIAYDRNKIGSCEQFEINRHGTHVCR